MHFGGYIASFVATVTYDLHVASSSEMEQVVEMEGRDDEIVRERFEN